MLLGDPDIGKSSLLLRYTDDSWTDSNIATIGVDYKSKFLELNGNKIELQVWDTGGQERFRTITSSYYRGANGFIVMYDITDASTFNDANNWIQDVQKYANDNCAGNIVLVGCKSDKTDEKDVALEEAQEFASSHAIQHFQTSAKENTNVDQPFEALAKIILKQEQEKNDNLNQITGKSRSKTATVDRVTISNQVKKDKNKGCILL